MTRIESIEGVVTTADGTRRAACKNTYKVTTFSDDGTSATVTEEVRIEFVLFTNAARGGSRRYRRTTAKQAATFVASS
jgi:hypothetical protein